MIPLMCPPAVVVLFHQVPNAFCSSFPLVNILTNQSKWQIIVIEAACHHRRVVIVTGVEGETVSTIPAQNQSAAPLEFNFVQKSKL